MRHFLGLEVPEDLLILLFVISFSNELLALESTLAGALEIGGLLRHLLYEVRGATLAALLH